MQGEGAESKTEKRFVEMEANLCSDLNSPRRNAKR